MKTLGLIFLVLTLVLAGAVVTAQDDDGLQCDPDEIATSLQWAIDTLTAAQDGTAGEQYQAIIDVRIALVALDSACLDFAPLCLVPVH